MKVRKFSFLQFWVHVPYWSARTLRGRTAKPDPAALSALCQMIQTRTRDSGVYKIKRWRDWGSLSRRGWGSGVLHPPPGQVAVPALWPLPERREFRGGTEEHVWADCCALNSKQAVRLLDKRSFLCIKICIFLSSETSTSSLEVFLCQVSSSFCIEMTFHLSRLCLQMPCAFQMWTYLTHTRFTCKHQRISSQRCCIQEKATNKELEGSRAPSSSRCSATRILTEWSLCLMFVYLSLTEGLEEIQPAAAPQLHLFFLLMCWN